MLSKSLATVSNSAMDCENTRADAIFSVGPRFNVTVSFWVKMDVLSPSSTTGDQRVIDLFENIAYGDYIFFKRTSPTDFEIEYQINSQKVSSTFTSNNLESGQWCHIVLQSVKTSANNNQFQFFLNGSLQTATSTSLNLANSGDAFQAGANLSISRASNFPGLVDDIQLFDRTLSNQEITAVYNSAPCTGIINIPDTNFKTELLAIPSLDFNGNNEIDCFEASNFDGTIDVRNKNIADLTGIEAFTKLRVLNCSRNPLTSIDLSANSSLVNITCNNMPSLTSLNVTNGINGVNITVGSTSIANLLDATASPNLSCIQHDTNFNPNNNSNWYKDSTANWSTNCSATSCTSIVNIPDTNFKNALLAHGTAITGAGISVIDTDGDGEICTTEAQAYSGAISVVAKSISNLSGIEAFVNITSLDCGFNQLNAVDVSANTLLNYLDVTSNNLTSIDVSSNTALVNFLCEINGLTSLDISGNTSITYLNCQDNQLTNLNVANGNNTNMTLSANNNSSLNCIQHDTGFDPTTNNNWVKDVSASWSTNCSACIVTIPDPVFKSLLVGNTAINTNGNSEIECSEAAAYTGAINANSVAVDPLGNPNAISDFTGLEAFVNLTEFDGGYNSFTTLDLSANTALEILELEGMGLTSLDLSNQIALRELDLDFNNITSMDLSSNLNLVNVSISSNGLTSLNVTGCSNLVNLFCGNNQLASLDVSSNTVLERLRCHLNPLTSIDVSSNLSLISLQINNCQLTSLDVSANTNLEELYCQTNQLTSLNVANGNSSNMTFMEARLNSNLSCIQHDTGFDPTTVSVWQKDGSATWSTNCSSLSVNDFSFENDLILYPNPANGIVTISTSFGNISNIKVFSILGEKVLETEQLKIDISKMKNGIYIFRIENEIGKAAVKKVVKQ